MQPSTSAYKWWAWQPSIRHEQARERIWSTRHAGRRRTTDILIIQKTNLSFEYQSRSFCFQEVSRCCENLVINLQCYATRHRWLCDTLVGRKTRRFRGWHRSCQDMPNASDVLESTAFIERVRVRPISIRVKGRSEHWHGNSWISAAWKPSPKRKQ